MQFDSPILIVEINNFNYIFVAAEYNENQKLKIVKKIITSSEGINNNKFTDINKAQECIKKNILMLEDKLGHVFKDVIILIDNFDYTCLNLSGFKKLNGSQLIKENITYILNSLKSSVIEHEKDKTILHIFNSKSVLDGQETENLPIGLFGNFYNHELSFFLIQNNDLRNIRSLFNKNNLNVKKILIKRFIEGTQLIKQNIDTETFFFIKINEDVSQINYFENSSFKFKEKFNFGSKIILNDISKVCSLDHKTIKKILSDYYFINNKLVKDDEILDKKYFTNENFRKIRKKLIQDIVYARVEEILDMIYRFNINLKYLKNNCNNIYISIEDSNFKTNFEEIFKTYFFENKSLKVNFLDNFNEELLILSAVNLSIFGWKKEAIPITQTKNSLITRIFKSLFG
tara:strand:- start:18256 stop:19458 length:1203 start_codon:yes stop_codon:yes gene_type:complete